MKVKGMLPEEVEMFDMVDSAFFTGCISQTKEKLEFIERMMGRWDRELQKHLKDPAYLIEEEED